MSGERWVEVNYEARVHRALRVDVPDKMSASEAIRHAISCLGRRFVADTLADFRAADASLLSGPADDPTEIESDEIVGECESCSDPLLEGDEGVVDCEDGVTLCAACFAKWERDAAGGDA